MIKGAAIFAAGSAAGLAVGTAYGFLLGVRLSKSLEKMTKDINEHNGEASNATVPGEAWSTQEHMGDMPDVRLIEDSPPMSFTA